MPFEFAIENAGVGLREIKKDYHQNLAQLKSVYSSRIDTDAIIGSYIQELKETIFNNGTFFLLGIGEEIFSLLLE